MAHNHFKWIQLTVLHLCHSKAGAIIFKVKKQSHYRPAQAQRVFRKLRLPDFVTTAQDGGRLSALRIGRLYPQEIILVLISVRC